LRDFDKGGRLLGRACGQLWSFHRLVFSTDNPPKPNRHNSLSQPVAAGNIAIKRQRDSLRATQQAFLPSSPQWGTPQ
jgi:hypothetical protein